MKSKLASVPVARPFHRSEAFAEDVADLVESATVIAAKRRRAGGGSSRLALLTLLPLGAVALGVAVVLTRLF
jgi:hypothetical protein